MRLSTYLHEIRKMPKAQREPYEARALQELQGADQKLAYQRLVVDVAAHLEEDIKWDRLGRTDSEQEETANMIIESHVQEWHESVRPQLPVSAFLWTVRKEKAELVPERFPELLTQLNQGTAALIIWYPTQQALELKAAQILMKERETDL